MKIEKKVLALLTRKIIVKQIDAAQVREVAPFHRNLTFRNDNIMKQKISLNVQKFKKKIVATIKR